MPFPGFFRTSSGSSLRFSTATPACPQWVFPPKSEKVKMRNEPNPTQENYLVCLDSPQNCLPAAKGSSILITDLKGPVSIAPCSS